MSPLRTASGKSGARRAVAAVLLSVVTAACAAQQGASAAKPTPQTGAAACNSARGLVQQALRMNIAQGSAAQYGQAVSLAAQIRALADATNDSVVKEQLEYDADAVSALAAAAQAGDTSAALGAQAVLAGFTRACSATSVP